MPHEHGLLRATPIPARAGVGLKAMHCRHIVSNTPDVGFFEIHAENYMGGGGPPHRFLAKIREHYPLSIHGVGLSIGGDNALDKMHLERLSALIARYQPGLFSEHLAWSTHDGRFYNDLLPAPYTNRTLTLVVEHIDQVQAALGCQMLLENPSTYVWFAESTWHEVDFIGEVVRRTGCGLLLDVNNVHVACTNQQWDSTDYINRFPLSVVQEIHLAGHHSEVDDRGRPLLIDSHDRSVEDTVWQLFQSVIIRTGPVPTVIEWDTNIPQWTVLQQEAVRAEAVMGLTRKEMSHYGVAA
jgi:uncharacterized protein (UPF0276 family)